MKKKRSNVADLRPRHTHALHSVVQEQHTAAVALARRLPKVWFQNTIDARRRAASSSAACGDSGSVEVIAPHAASGASPPALSRFVYRPLPQPRVSFVLNIGRSVRARAFACVSSWRGVRLEISYDHPGRARFDR